MVLQEAAVMCMQETCSKAQTRVMYQFYLVSQSWWSCHAAFVPSKLLRCC